MEKEIKKIYNSVISEDIRGLKLRRFINKKGIETPKKQNMVFLTIGNNHARAYVIKGVGKNLRKAIQNAIENYIKFKPKKFYPKQLKVDILSEYEPLKSDGRDFDFNNHKINYDIGIEGLAFGSNFHTVFLPSEMVSYQLVSEQKLQVQNSFKAIQRHLPSTFSDFTKPIDYRLNTLAYKIRTESFYIDNEQKVYRLFRDHRIYPSLTKEDLVSAIKLVKDNYFKNVVNKNGKFIYSYLPQINKSEQRYNILRHAGTIYSMLEVYEIMPDQQLLKQAKRAIRFLLRSIKPFNINNTFMKVVVERDCMKVGGNALAIIALAKYTKITGDKQYISIMRELAYWFRENQDEKGEFIIHKQKYSTGKAYDFTSRFYPGEAILALVRLYQIDKDKVWLDIAENAAHFLINIRDGNETVDTITPDHWLLYGLNELYRERNNDMYLGHSILISEAIMKDQITKDNASRRELIGGYATRTGKDPSSTPVACRSEGLTAAYQLMRYCGYDELAERIKHSIHQGIKYQLQMQLRTESVLHYQNKKLLLGSIQRGLKEHDLRIDYTQHNISSFVNYYLILKSFK